MAYQVEDLTRLKHLLELGQRILTITDDHNERITALENAEGGILFGTTAQWQAQPTFIPAAGTVVIYTDYARLDDKNVPNFKVGDGNAYLIDLPFSQDDLRAIVAAHIADNTRHLTPEERTKIEDSVTVDVQGSNLIFS